MANMTLEQFEIFAQTLPEGANRRKLAKALGLELPPDPVAPIADQLSEVEVVKHTPKAAKGQTATERTYVSVPNLKLSETESARGFWVRTDVARQVAARILEVCDANGL